MQKVIVMTANYYYSTAIVISINSLTQSIYGKLIVRMDRYYDHEVHFRTFAIFFYRDTPQIYNNGFQFKILRRRIK